MLTSGKYQRSPGCPHCDKPTRRTPSFFGILFELEIFECDLCGLVVIEQAAAKVSQLPKLAVLA